MAARIAAVADVYDALISDLRTETVYSLGNGSNLIQNTNGLNFGTVDSLHELNGQTGALTGRRVALSSSVPIANRSGQSLLIATREIERPPGTKILLRSNPLIVFFFVPPQ